MSKRGLIMIISIGLIAGIIGGTVAQVLNSDAANIYSSRALPADFPDAKTMTLIYTFVFTLAGFALGFILTELLNVNRKKNAVVNFAFFMASIFGWNFLIFQSGNLTGGIAILVAAIVIGVIAIAMFWLINKKAGYFLFPSLLFVFYALALNISLLVAGF